MCASGQQISALWTIVTLDQRVFGEGLEDFGQQLERDVIFFRDFLCIHHPSRGHVAKLNRSDVLEGHESVIGFFRNLQHCYCRSPRSETIMISDQSGRIKSSTQVLNLSIRKNKADSFEKGMGIWAEPILILKDLIMSCLKHPIPSPLLLLTAW